MSRTRKREPSYRDLDIYRLVVARMWKQKNVAANFRINPSRISQVVRRVREWVDGLVGDWLFPRQPHLRFYAALDKAEIRLLEYDDPHLAVFEHASGRHRYTRQAPTILEGNATPHVEPEQPDTVSPTSSSAQQRMERLAHALTMALMSRQPTRSSPGDAKSGPASPCAMAEANRTA